MTRKVEVERLDGRDSLGHADYVESLCGSPHAGSHLNIFSLHGGYRNRLIRGFLGAWRPDTVWEEI